MGCEPGFAQGGSQSGHRQVQNDMAHDLDTNAGSRMTCIGSIRQRATHWRLWQFARESTVIDEPGLCPR